VLEQIVYVRSRVQVRLRLFQHGLQGKTHWWRQILRHEKSKYMKIKVKIGQMKEKEKENALN